MISNKTYHDKIISILKITSGHLEQFYKLSYLTH